MSDNPTVADKDIIATNVATINVFLMIDEFKAIREIINRKIPDDKPGLSSGIFRYLTTMNRIDKKTAIEHIYTDIEACVKCRELEGVGTVTVFSRGSPYAGCMIIGEGPGEQEELQQRPFVGNAGALLDGTLQKLGFDIGSDFYITNIVKHRSFKLLESKKKENKPPTAKQIALEREYLEREIETISPKLIVTLGAKASQWFLGRDFRLTKSHGNLYDWHGIPILPTYHPSAVLRALGVGGGEERRRDFASDLNKIHGLLDRSRAA